MVLLYLYFLSLAWNYVGMWWHAVFVIHLFTQNFVLNHCDYLCNIFIKQAIWKSKCWDLSINIDTAKCCFSLTKILLKTFKYLNNKTFMTNTTLALNYLAPVSLCCNYSSLSLFLSLSLSLSLCDFLSIQMHSLLF